MSKPFIVIFNGLSAEGVSVIECLLETSEHMWRIRCIVLQSEMSNPIIHSMVSRGVDVIAIPSSSFSSDYFQNAKVKKKIVRNMSNLAFKMIFFKKKKK